MLNGEGKLQSIAFVVSMIVVIGLAITFSILLFLYGRYKINNIKYGHEDAAVEKEVRRKYKKVIENNINKVIDEKDAFKYVLYQKQEQVTTWIQESDPEHKVPVVKEVPISIHDTITNSKEKNKVWQVIMNVLFGIFYFVIGALLLVAITFKVTNQTMYFGDTTLMTIRTGSMEKAHESNTYLEENNLTNQIEQFSLIALNKVHSEDELKLYDIAAYKHEDVVYVHRIIRIFHNETENKTYYTFRGDSNAVSADFELTITIDDIVGKYNGFQNYGLGVTLTYMQSNIGMIALCSGILFLLTFNITESKIETAYYKRTLTLAEKIDNELQFNRGFKNVKK